MRSIIRGLALAAALSFGLFFTGSGQAAEPQVQMHHLFLKVFDEETIEIQEQLVFQEALPEDAQLTFSLPDGVQDIQFLQGIAEGEATIEGNDLKINSVTPQAESIKYAYLLSMQGAPHAILNQVINYDTEVYFVISPLGELKVSGGELEDAGVEAMGETQYELRMRENVPAGTEMNIVVVRNYGDDSQTSGGQSGKSSGGFTRKEAPEFHSAGHIRFWQQSPFSGMDAHLFLILAVVLPVLAIILYIRQRRLKAGDKGEEEQSEEDIFQQLAAREKVLKEKLKQLELGYRQGEIDKDDYSVKHEVYKKKLVEVRIKLKKFTE